MSIEPRPHAPVRLAVLTCGDLGFETAQALARVPEAEVVAIVQAPPRRGSVKSRVRTLWRRQGPAGFVRLMFRKAGSLARLLAQREKGPPGLSLPSSTLVLRFDDLHSEQCLEAVRELDLDLAVVDGTYILRESLFGLPRNGSINLHCGKLPDYRGAPPAFWELLQGESQVGVTIHQVSAEVDEGPVLKERLLPLDPAPSQDPMRYIEGLWRDVLRPAGIQMIGEVVTEMASGALTPTPQDRETASTYRFPDRHAVRDLRRQVRLRRRKG